MHRLEASAQSNKRLRSLCVEPACKLVAVHTRAHDNTREQGGGRRRGETSKEVPCQGHGTASKQYASVTVHRMVCVSMQETSDVT